MVLCLATADWTWPRLFRSTARSIVAFILILYPCLAGPSGGEKSLKGRAPRTIRRPTPYPRKCPPSLTNAPHGASHACNAPPIARTQAAMRRALFPVSILLALPAEIGRASCRERVDQSV